MFPGLVNILVKSTLSRGGVLQVVSDNNFKSGFDRCVHKASGACKHLLQRSFVLKCPGSWCSVYDHNLARGLRTIFKRHETLFEGIGGEYQPDLAANCRTIRDFDDAITRVSFGWPSVDAYYAGSGSDQVLCSLNTHAYGLVRHYDHFFRYLF